MHPATSANTFIRESQEEPRAHELMTLMRKLRWIGEDTEAEKLQSTLQLCKGRPCVLASAWDTD
jgi:hypothetical protein